MVQGSPPAGRSPAGHPLVNRRAVARQRRARRPGGFRVRRRWGARGRILSKPSLESRRQFPTHPRAPGHPLRYFRQSQPASACARSVLFDPSSSVASIHLCRPILAAAAPPRAGAGSQDSRMVRTDVKSQVQGVEIPRRSTPPLRRSTARASSAATGRRRARHRPVAVRLAALRGFAPCMSTRRKRAACHISVAGLRRRSSCARDRAGTLWRRPVPPSATGFAPREVRADTSAPRASIREQSTKSPRDSTRMEPAPVSRTNPAPRRARRGSFRAAARTERRNDSPAVFACC